MNYRQDYVRKTANFYQFFPHNFEEYSEDTGREFFQLENERVNFFPWVNLSWDSAEDYDAQV